MTERTAQEWADYIAAAIKSARADGSDVWIQNDCCGCSVVELLVSGDETVKVEL